MKEKRMRSTRYRFWRNVVFIAMGGVVGFIAGSLVGYYDLAVEIDFSRFINLKAVQDIMIVAIFLLFLGTLYYLHISRESMSRLEKMEDDEEIESLEQAGNRAYALAGILTNLMQIPFMFYAATGFAEVIRHTDFNILLAFGKLFFLVLLITVASILVRKGFKTVNGEELPRYSNRPKISYYSTFLRTYIRRNLYSIDRRKIRCIKKLKLSHGCVLRFY